MASGDLTASTPVFCEGITAVKTAVDTLNLAATTDKLVVLPVPSNPANPYAYNFVVFKVERTA